MLRVSAYNELCLLGALSRLFWCRPPLRVWCAQVHVCTVVGEQRATVGVLETSVFTRSAPPLPSPWSRYNREGDLLFTAAKDAVSPASRTLYQRATGLGPSLPALSCGERRDE